MLETEYAHDGVCPRCGGKAITREVIYQTTKDMVFGVAFSCDVCAFEARAQASDREGWFDTHKEWASPAVADTSFEKFKKRWPKKVGNPAYGDPEPVGPIVPVVSRQ